MAESLPPQTSITKTDPKELAGLSKLTAPERAWYENNWPVFDTHEDIIAAAETGLLVEVKQDENLALVGRMRNPDYGEEYEPYLLPHSLVALRSIGRMWRRQLSSRGLWLPETRLSVTSLVRSDDKQQKLVAEGKLAEPNSTHRNGAAFDMDGSGYYMINGAGVLVPVAHPDRPKDAVSRITGAIQSRDPHPYQTPTGDYTYDPRIPEALLVVVENLHEKGIINLIVEFGVYDRCLHIAPNPEAATSIAA